MRYDKVVAIDGPGGSGKSTMAKTVAYELDFLYVDTGAMFRAIGLYLNNKGIPFYDEINIGKRLEQIDFEYNVSPRVLIKIDGEDLTVKIREHNVSELASKVSKIESVRSYLLKTQREIAQQKICVMEGRDIGTVVFPDAFCKIFLTADPRVRAKRRFDQLNKGKKVDLTIDQILKDIVDRDERDMKRKIAPLKQATDAVFLDTSRLGEMDVLEKIKDIVNERLLLLEEN